MKKCIAVLAAVLLIWAHGPALAAKEVFHSELMNWNLELPSSVTMLGEHAYDNGIVMFMVSTDQTRTQILSTLRYVDAYKGETIRSLPKEELDAWTSQFHALYPRLSQGGRVWPSTNSDQRIYRYYGRSDEGVWVLNYTGVYDGVYVSTYGEAGRYGFTRAQMTAIFQAFNMLMAASCQANGVDFQGYDEDIFDVVVEYLLYDDRPDGPFA